MIGRFWVIHHTFFGSLSRFDGWLITRNLLYLALIALVPFTSEVLGTYGDEPAGAITYAAVLGFASLVNWLMVNHAVGNDLARPDARAATERFGAPRALIIPGVFLVSIPVALLSPTAAELMWLGVIFFRVRGFGDDG